MGIELVIGGLFVIDGDDIRILGILTIEIFLVLMGFGDPIIEPLLIILLPAVATIIPMN